MRVSDSYRDFARNLSLHPDPSRRFSYMHLATNMKHWCELRNNGLMFVVSAHPFEDVCRISNFV